MTAAKDRAKPRSKQRKPPAGAPPAKPDLRIVQTQVFRGPNYFSYDPAIVFEGHRSRLPRSTTSLIAGS